jgi:hypothetical protein
MEEVEFKQSALPALGKGGIEDVAWLKIGSRPVHLTWEGCKRMACRDAEENETRCNG